MAQSIDDLLGPPSAEDLLGPEAVSPGAGAPGGPADEILGPRVPQIEGPQRYANIISGALLRGVAGVAGIPGEVEAAGNAFLPSWLTANPLTGGPPAQLFPTTGQLISKFGLAASPAITPQNELERLLSAGASGVGAGMPFGLGALLPAATGGVSAELAHEAMPDSRLAPIVAGIAGGAGAQGLQTGVENLVLGPRLARTAASLGPASTLQEAGTTAQAAARDWLTNEFPARQAAAWAPVDALVPGTSQVPLHEFESTLSRLSTKAGDLQPLAERLGAGSLPAQLLKIYANRTAAGGLNIPASWNDVKALRSSLGEALADPKTVKDIPQAQLSDLYRALTDDMREGARAAGGDPAVAAFDAANEASTKLHAFAEGPLARLISGKAPSASDPLPEKAATSLVSGGKSGGTDLAALAAEMPDAVSNLAAAVVRSKPGLWSKLSPEGKNALVPDASTRAILDEHLPARAAVHMPTASADLAAAVPTGAMGGLLSHFFGLDHATGAELGAVLGTAAPFAWQAGRYALARPGVLRGPFVGGLAGGNELLPPVPGETVLPP